MSARITLLAGGNTVYVYPDCTDDRELAGRIGTQRMVLDVAHPADETLVRVVEEADWPKIQAALLAADAEIVDTRSPA